MFGDPFRLDPPMPVTAYRTFGIAKPLATHWRAATCEEAECEAYLNGWATHLDLNVELDKERADYIRRHSGRRFDEMKYSDFRFKEFGGHNVSKRDRADPRTSFVFHHGQTCFAAADHRVPLEREGVYTVRGGDWRGNPTREHRVHVRPADWVDEFAEHQDRLKTLQERG